MTAYDDILSSARRCVLEAGELIQRMQAEGFQTRYKGKDDPVTSADLASDALLRERLARVLPEAGWMSEETPDDLRRLNCRRVWLVDPIDGTKEYLAGRGEYTISVALAEWGKPVIGLIYNPSAQEMFEAVAGGGLRLNGQPVGPARPVGRKPVLVCSKTEIAKGRWKSLEAEAEIRPCGSTAYALAQVAAGRADGMFSLSGKNEWDIAAGALMICQAGGTVTDRNGTGLSFNRRRRTLDGIIAARAGAHEAVLRMVAMSGR